MMMRERIILVSKISDSAGMEIKTKIIPKEKKL
jgi:hypothetical protein